MKRVIAIVVLLVTLLGVSTTTQAQSVPPYSVYLPIVMKPAIPPTYLTNPPIAKNHLETQYQNGVTLELSRIYIASKDYLVREDPSFGTYPIFDDSQTLVEIMFTITNNTGMIIHSNVWTGAANFNSEQVPYTDPVTFESVTVINNLTQQDILPGSTIEGGYWLGVKNSAWNQINSITVLFPHFFKAGVYSSVTSDFLFNVKVENWVFEPNQ